MAPASSNYVDSIDKIQTVVECIKLGAFDYLAKPLIVEELLVSIQRALESSDIRGELEQRRRLQLAENREYRLLGKSAAMKKVRKEIDVVAVSDSPVLIVGETGTGKELVAREIHARSARASEPFVAVNCGAIAKDLFESEFFGHKKGAYTGAGTSEIGKFQLANRGTLVLDEIGELPFDAQTKLLRVLENHEFYPVGSTELMHVDVRVLAATNRNLEDLVQQRLFREDLFFRLNVYTIGIPPLRERLEDIEVLAEFYLAHFNVKLGKEFRELSTEAQDVLRNHHWKGNVRELRNLMERIILSEDGTAIEKKHLLGLLPFAYPADASDLKSCLMEGVSMRFLIVESYAETKLHLQRAVASMGHEITVCEEGNLGWESYQAEHYPVVILDQVLPDMDGTELCRRIHAEHRRAATVVLLVAACGPKDALELLDCGADDFLFLPLNADRLKLQLALAERLASERLANNRADQTTAALVKAVEIMKVGVTISDLEGRILYTNVAEARMHGYEPSELEGQNVRLFSPSSNWKWMTRDEIKQIKGWRRHSVNVRKDGTTFPVQLTSDVVFDAAGDPMGIVTTCEDISDALSTFLRPAG